MSFSLHVQLIDLFERRIRPVRVDIANGLIQDIQPTEPALTHGYMCPGFVDAHVHIESSMLVPSEFARLAVTHGTVATVSDPHEIANVLGIDGVTYMLENAEQVPFKFHFGAPSCVPATTFETAGATIDANAVASLLDDHRILYLSEVMNFPGVIGRDPELMKKIEAAIVRNKRVDGHAPGVRGEALAAYVSAGIQTDHECVTLEEAREKALLGMKIIIREGSAARNFDALIPLLGSTPELCMFCSDDKHPDELVFGHINLLVERAFNLGYDLFDILRVASVNPVLHYGLNVGLCRVGDPADFILVDDLSFASIRSTYIDGHQVASDGVSAIGPSPICIVNAFEKPVIGQRDLRVPALGSQMKVIDIHDGQLVTSEGTYTLPAGASQAEPDVREDVLKLVVVNRYRRAAPSVAFARGFGLKSGALASTIAHDSHNIVAIGCSDEDICRAIDLLSNGGGISVVGSQEHVLELPVAGLMSNLDGHVVAEQYRALDRTAKEMGSQLRAPFMTLSFLALLVIPELKLSDLGLFRTSDFGFVPLFSDTVE